MKNNMQDKLDKDIEKILTLRFKREFIKGVYEIAKPEPRNRMDEWCEMKFQELVKELSNLCTQREREAEGRVKGAVFNTLAIEMAQLKEESMGYKVLEILERCLVDATYGMGVEEKYLVSGKDKE